MKKKINILALLTITLFPLIGFGIIFVSGESILPVFDAPEPIWLNLLVGVPFGIIAGFCARYIVSRDFMKPVLDQYGDLVKSLNINHWQIWFISFCAGVGEEILFRGAIQPLLGIWVTALIFVAIHGYLNPFNWRISSYGIFMTLVIAAIGYASISVGLYSAMAAHMMIDVVLLYYLSNRPDEAPLKSNEYADSTTEDINNTDLDSIIP